MPGEMLGVGINTTLVFLGLIARLQLEYWRCAHGVYYAGLVTMMPLPQPLSASREPAHRLDRGSRAEKTQLILGAHARIHPIRATAQ